MIKKKTVVLFVFIIVIFIGGVFMVIIRNKSPKVKDFDLNDYQHYIDNYPSEEELGSVIDSKDAIKKAELIWINMYGEIIKKEKPYQVFYDEKKKVWLIRGTLKADIKGGVANILIQNKNGKVLAVWHEK